MRLYQAHVSQFIEDVQLSKIADILATAYRHAYKREVSEGEYRSWHYSLRFMKDSLDIVKLDDCHIVLEHQMPYTSNRLDIMLFGKDIEEKDFSVVVELKQWTEIQPSDIDGNILTPIGGGLRECAHPSLQVGGYVRELEDSYHVFEDKPQLHLSGTVFCHNLDSQSSSAQVLFASGHKQVLINHPVYTKSQIKEFGEYLRERLGKGNGTSIFERFDRSKIQPSKRLLKEFKGMISGNTIFNLIDEQITAFNAIMSKVRQIQSSKQKSVIIIEGGPGTGKSVIAIEAMIQLMQRGLTVFHATGSASLTKTFQNHAGKRAAMFFKFFYSFTKHEENSIDVLICDEAHRLREHSNDWGVPYMYKSKNPQIDDIIRPGKISIFFIDENQVVRPTEKGSVKMIEDAAIKFGASVHKYELKTQFRCSGSDAYLQWLDKVLHIRESDFNEFDAKMEFKIFDDPNEMMKQIKMRNQEVTNSARIVAGFCWPWSKPNKDGSLVNDVVIGDFAMPWEHREDFWRWAHHSIGMEQVGTVYTAQGFEFDYIGVIFGKDLVWDRANNDWKAQPEYSQDKMLKRNNPEVLRHLKNIYRVLLSRAHKGVFVYFEDKETEKYFKERLSQFE